MAFYKKQAASMLHGFHHVVSNATLDGTERLTIKVQRTSGASVYFIKLPVTRFCWSGRSCSERYHQFALIGNDLHGRRRDKRSLLL
ncbi:hypothetical protein KKP04_05780 [Rhodomicrobium sp. Az07]|uniref:hypothetical protein n=1 Tax=Rhodomicrobium sp. Az07 TaxID=2839034 RepID=UPI001BEA673F|nr:hypothetical protein [Rhodomicrobium sp. Az07]MBT3070374.1 hypothetical protein [Rhodomicrobium sp. Az07]